MPVIHSSYMLYNTVENKTEKPGSTICSAKQPIHPVHIDALLTEISLVRALEKPLKIILFPLTLSLVVIPVLFRAL